MGDFFTFLAIVGGAIAGIVAVMVVPAFRNAQRESSGSLCGRGGNTPAQILVVSAYVLMGVGSIASL